MTKPSGDKVFTVTTSLEKEGRFRLGRPLTEQELRIYNALDPDDQERLSHLPANSQRDFFNSLKKYF